MDIIFNQIRRISFGICWRAFRPPSVTLVSLTSRDCRLGTSSRRSRPASPICVLSRSKTCETPQFFQMCHAGVRDLRSCEIELFQRGQILQVLQAGVGEFGRSKVQVVEILQTFQMHKAGAVDLGFPETQVFQFGEVLEVPQAGVGDVRLLQVQNRVGNIPSSFAKPASEIGQPFNQSASSFGSDFNISSPSSVMCVPLSWSEYSSPSPARCFSPASVIGCRRD